MLADQNISLCLSDHHDAPAPWKRTADFVYIRGHGPGGRYKGHYPKSTLTEWARRIRSWKKRGIDVYVYFDNDQKSAAPADALEASTVVDVRIAEGVGEDMRRYQYARHSIHATGAGGPFGVHPAASHAHSPRRQPPFATPELRIRQCSSIARWPVLEARSESVDQHARRPLSPVVCHRCGRSQTKERA